MASTTTDRANKWKTMTMDVFGNLATVTRTQRSRSHNKLITVSMPRDGITRTFNYNCQLQLTSVVQPENGTTSYTYNTDKTAATKTDAKGQIAAYTYDSLKRVIQITRSTSVGNPVACAQTNYYYYANPVDPSFTQYATGRLATVITGNPYCTPGQITEMYSYNGSGGITKKRILVRHPHKVVIHDCRQLSAQL